MKVLELSTCFGTRYGVTPTQPQMVNIGSEPEQKQKKPADPPLHLLHTFAVCTQVRVGDVIIVKRGESVPADCALLATSSTNGMCYVMTANLDGETNLKLKQVAPGALKVCGRDRCAHVHSIQHVTAILPLHTHTTNV